jgi:glucosylglycerate synthase
LAEGTFLNDEFLRQLTAVGEVDLLVGIATFNDAKTIQHVIQAVQIGLVKYFPRQRTVLVNPDGGSRDGTPEAS